VCPGAAERPTDGRPPTVSCSQCTHGGRSPSPGICAKSVMARHALRAAVVVQGVWKAACRGTHCDTVCRGTHCVPRHALCAAARTVCRCVHCVPLHALSPLCAAARTVCRGSSDQGQRFAKYPTVNDLLQTCGRSFSCVGSRHLRSRLEMRPRPKW
jgi:hypothetical protein